MHLISIDIKSDFGFFRKPETNNTLNVSYNMIHKPAILGILGAIVGLKGYQEKGKLPEYYEKLSHLKIGIAPLNHDCGNFMKTTIKYSNTVGYANKGTNFLTEELTLISPNYRIFLLLNTENDLEQKLYHHLENGKSEFIPYFGKNEFTAWWDNFQVFEYQRIEEMNEEKIKIDSIFLKSQSVSKNSELPAEDFGFLDILNSDETPFLYFERLPIDFNLDLMQYQLAETVFTNYKLKNVQNMQDLFHLKNSNAYIQLI